MAWLNFSVLPIAWHIIASTSSFQDRIYPLTYKSMEDEMVADWIVIYAVLFVLAAAVVGRVPADT